MPKQFDSHNAMAAFDHDSTLVVALELSGKSWQVGAVVPGVVRRPRRLEPCDMTGLLKAIDRWTAEASGAGRAVQRVALTYEAGRDGFGSRAACWPAGSRSRSCIRRAFRWSGPADG
jgi:transposase